MTSVVIGAVPAAAQAPSPSVRDLSFMAGCCEGSFVARDGSDGVIEEHYTAPSDDLVLGTTRYLLDGKAVQFELTSIRDVDGLVSLLPYPGGVASPDTFRLTRVEDGATVFEAPRARLPQEDHLPPASQ